MYRGADKSLARPGRRKATATEDFEFCTSVQNGKNTVKTQLYLLAMRG